MQNPCGHEPLWVVFRFPSLVTANLSLVGAFANKSSDVDVKRGRFSKLTTTTVYIGHLSIYLSMASAFIHRYNLVRHPNELPNSWYEIYPIWIYRHVYFGQDIRVAERAHVVLPPLGGWRWHYLVDRGAGRITL